MNLKEQFNGIQHIGIRPMILKQPLIFYKALGFENCFFVQ